MSAIARRIGNLEGKLKPPRVIPAEVLERLQDEPGEVQYYATNIVKTGRAEAPLLEVLLGHQASEALDVMHLRRAYEVLELQMPKVEAYMTRLIEVR